MARIAIIGGGHNGLVAALRLGRAGHTVDVFERRDMVGGACETRERPCGCKFDTGADMLIALHTDLWNELSNEFDLELIPSPPTTLHDDRGGRFVPENNQEWRTWDEKTAAWAVLFAEKASHTSFDLESLKSEWRRLYGLSNFSLAEAVRSHFRGERDQIVAASGGIPCPMRMTAPDSLFTFLAVKSYKNEQHGYVRGGIGRITQGLATLAEEAGVTVHLNTGVRELMLERVGGELKVQHLTTEDDSNRAYDFVVSNADPHSLLALIRDDWSELIAVRKKINDESYDGGAGKLNVLLPKAVAREFVNPGMHVYQPRLDFLDECFDTYQKGKLPDTLYTEVAFKGDLDPSVSCGEHYSAAMFMQFVPYETDDESLRRVAINTAHAIELPSLAAAIAQANTQILTPKKLGERFGFYRACIDHVHMRADRLFQRRDEFVKFPIANLSFCGSSRAPGGMVSGIPGMRAAEELLSRLAGV